VKFFELFHLMFECRCFSGILDTRLLIAKRKMKFVHKYCNSEDGLCKLFADTASRECKMLVMSM